jgi:hypothetical protein
VPSDLTNRSDGTKSKLKINFYQANQLESDYKDNNLENRKILGNRSKNYNS